MKMGAIPPQIPGQNETRCSWVSFWFLILLLAVYVPVACVGTEMFTAIIVDLYSR